MEKYFIYTDHLSLFPPTIQGEQCVTLEKRGSYYYFTTASHPEEIQTYYPWVFFKDTPEGRAAVGEIIEKRKAARLLEKRIDSLYGEFSLQA